MPLRPRDRAALRSRGPGRRILASAGAVTALPGTALAPVAPSGGVSGPASRQSPVRSAERPVPPAVAPVLTVVIPCFNSAEYIARALEPLLSASHPLEVVLVDDGSTDDTPALVDRYAREHPGVVRAVHQRNGGHGAAMSTGIAHATGRYLKVLDSDDWVDPAAFEEYLAQLERWSLSDAPPDAVITNYVYENLGRDIRKVVRYRASMPTGRVCRWEDLRRPRTGSYFLMHALTYRTEVLRASGVEFPRHTFYVDNLMASVPLLQVRTLAYLDLDLYRYFIGREDQSVAEDVMISRLPQQLLVNRLLVDALRNGTPLHSAQARYLRHYAAIVSSVSLTLTVLAGTAQAQEEGRALLGHIRRTDPASYRTFLRTPMGMLLSVPGRAGEVAVRAGYRLARRRFGFN